MTPLRFAFAVLVGALFCGVVLPTELRAQSRTSSALRGEVVTNEGERVPNASVLLRNQQTGVVRQTLTNAEGRYLLLQLQPGSLYTLTVRSLGYAEWVREDVGLQVGETRTLDVVLTLDAVEVSGVEVAVDRSEVFNPTQVGPATRISERVVESLPLPSRNVMELAVLSPLVKATEDGGFSIAGQNSRYNSILIDGVLNKDMFGLTSGGVPGGRAGGKLIPLDAVAQYEVLVAPFDVRQSGFTGGVLNAVTRTGTNDWWARAFAVGRTEELTGDLVLPTGPVEASGVKRTLFGASVGGPIVRDRAHVFFSAEVERRSQPPSGFNIFRDPAALTRISEETIEEISRTGSTFGLDVGEAGVFPVDTRLTNLFTRIDWTLNDRHRMIIRNIHADARTDEAPARGIFDAYELSSNGAERTAVSNTTSAQLFSDLGNGLANELTLQIQLSRDETTPSVTWPSVEIDAISQIDDAAFERPVRMGSEFFAQDNHLEQRVVRATNAFTRVRGDNNQVFGLTGAYYDFSHRFLPGSRGDFYFASLSDFADGAAQRFQRQFLTPGAEPGIGFEVIEAGAFAQAQIDAGKGLHMRFGLRADVPFVLGGAADGPVPFSGPAPASGRPGRNGEVLGEFGIDTSTLPSGRIILSPRWGFNWQSEGELRTQVRGGAGLFTGQIPFVWLSNAWHNDGLRSRTLTCSGRWTDDPRPPTAVPPFDTSALPENCMGADGWHRTVVAFTEDFEYPQDLKFSVVVDHELASSTTLSIGALFNKAINQVVLEELNLGRGSGSVGDVSGYGGFDRRYFGTASELGFEPNRELAGYEQVLLAKNASQDWGASLTLELRTRLGERLAMQAGYTLSKSYDRMSLVATDMVSNYGFTPTEYDPNRPNVTTSNFDRPHKVVFSLWGAPIPSLPDTRISLLYTGQSGAPFSYVYDGDINGDGYPGPGAAFDRTNDLIYVPNDASEIPMPISSQVVLNAALDADPCLRKYRGGIMPRNGCRAPWRNQLDLRISQGLDLPGGGEVRLEADVINLLNLLNGDWGRIESVRPVVPVIETVGRRQSRGVGDLVSRWGGAVLPQNGPLAPADPWSVETPGSQWQAQFGIRVTWGGGSR